MDEDALWQADLARRNINILNVDEDRVYYEFQYHPSPGVSRWCKTMVVLDDDGAGVDYDQEAGTVVGRSWGWDGIAEQVVRHALAMRKELEK